MAVPSHAPLCSMNLPLFRDESCIFHNVNCYEIETKMASLTNLLRFIVLATAFILIRADSKYRSESFTCRLLNSNYINAESLLEYPIVFEPVSRGHLTIWSGTSSLPGSGFKCYSGKNGTKAILMDFANFADRLEWTYFDANRGVTFHGFSVNHRENVVYKVHIDNGQSRNHMDCNKIKLIEAYREDNWYSNIKSACGDCRNSVLPLVNSQISEIFRSKLNADIIDGLHWHLSSLVSSQHYSGPISL